MNLNLSFPNRVKHHNFHTGVVAAGLLASATLLSAQAISLVPEQVPPVISDRQDSTGAARVKLAGWIGTRVHANEVNRLLKLDPERLLEGYRQRPGRQIWDGEHVGKWLHAATLAWANSGSPELRARLDYVAAELVKCQLPDGYLGTYTETNRWTLWDVWAHKYNLIGLITYIRHTGNLEPLPACRRMGDLLCDTFGDQPGKRDINPTSQHKGMASTSVLEPMMLLYRLTGEPRYLDFCNYILRAWEQPNGAKIVSTLLREKRVTNVGNGKAYEMLSCLNGALEYHRTTGEKDLLQACLYAWQDIVDKRLYLTGTASYREFFHGDHDLPNVNNVGETCVTVTWLQFNDQLLRLTGEARFAEQLEKTVLNHLFGAQNRDGTAWGYYVQLQGKKPYSDTLDGHCCLSSGPRGVALIPTFATTIDADGVVINLYEAGKATLALRDGSSVTLTTKTRFPNEEQVRITVSPSARKSFAVKLRIPAWCADASVRVNGRQVDLVAGPDGYVAIRREWKRDDQIELRLKLEPRVMIGERYTEGRLAVSYGPLVLAADEAALGAKAPALDAIWAAGPDLAALNVIPERAPAKLRSWPGAQVFRINAIARNNADQTRQGALLQLRLLPFADAGGLGSSYRVWLPFREPRPDRNLLMTGVELRSRKPHVGSILDGDLETIAATFENRRAADDWFGVTLEEPAVIGQVVFFHGKTFHNGGWFDSREGKPRVQIQITTGGEWLTVGTLTDYPDTTAASAAGLQGGERFVSELAEPMKAVAVRVIGNPASGSNLKQAFATCAELQAFAPGY
jgi:uncharacterized protein